MRWPTFTPKERTMPDTPEPGLVDLDLIDPETTADLGHATAVRPDPSHLAEFVDVRLPAEDVPADPDLSAAHAEHCPTCGQDVPSTRDLLTDTLDRVGHGAGVLVAEVRRTVIAGRPDLALLFRSDAESMGDEFMQHGGILAALFDPGNDETMANLNTYLDGLASADAKVGISDLDWPGGRRPPSLLDYATVNHHLVTALRAHQGDSWTPLHTRAWQTALTYAAARMCAAQILGGAR